MAVTVQGKLLQVSEGEIECVCVCVFYSSYISLCTAEKRGSMSSLKCSMEFP